MTVLQKNIKQTVIERSPIGVKCDICKENIEPFPKVHTDMNGNKYFEVFYFSCTEAYFAEYENSFSEIEYEICPRCLEKWMMDNAKEFLLKKNKDEKASIDICAETLKVYPEEDQF